MGVWTSREKAGRGNTAQPTFISRLHRPRPTVPIRMEAPRLRNGVSRNPYKTARRNRHAQRKFQRLFEPRSRPGSCGAVAVEVHRQNPEETAIPTGLIVSNPVVFGAEAQVRIAGGRDGAAYKLTFLATDTVTRRT